MIRWQKLPLLSTYCLFLIAITKTLSVQSKHLCLKTDYLQYHYTKDYCLSYEFNDIGKTTESVIEEPDSNTTRMSRLSGYNGLYRPRSALARALYEKQRNDRYLEELDQYEWYKVDFSRLNEDLKEKFVQLGPDEETKQFLNRSIDKSSWVWTQIWYLLAKSVLKHFWSITDINGWLGRGYMLVLSHEQAKALLLRAQEAQARHSIVDIGAGDGEVSKRISSLYEERYATEISEKMRNVLVKKGFKVLDTWSWWRGAQFSCVSMLNLLDRCSRPTTALREARTALEPCGLLLVALVLPYKPYVEVTPDHKPEERMPIKGSTFEEQAQSYVAFMKEIGYELVSWTRVPYLCEGDFTQAYYWLDDSVYLFKPISIMSTTDADQ